MKTLSTLAIISCVFVFVTGCKSFTNCEQIKHSEAVILIDVSDTRLYNEIERDFKVNFAGFMGRTGLGSISSCEKFTLSFAHMSGKESLNLTSASIAVHKPGQSKKAEIAQRNPAPLVALLQKTLTEYHALSNDQGMTSGSNIANTLFKAIVQTNDFNSGKVILVFSDMVESNNQMNFYRKIPAKKDIPTAIEKMIEPLVLSKFYQIRDEGLIAQIIIVLKPEPAGKTSIREIKNFWVAFFKELGIDAQVQFIDNLTNHVVL